MIRKTEIKLCNEFWVAGSIWLFMLMVIAVLFITRSVIAQEIDISKQVWDGSVIRPTGQPVIPLYEGWYENQDGTKSLCFGYFNLNTEQELDIPVGENNHIVNDRFEAMLPTHFEAMPPDYRRKYCVFTVQVPGDFSRNERVVWSLTSAGDTLEAPGHVLPAYVMDEPVSDGRGEVAPWVQTSENGDKAQGRNGVVANDAITAVQGEEVQLPAWLSHPSDSIWVGWAKHSGPGAVRFDRHEYMLDLEEDGSATRTSVQATFSESGDYVIRLQTIDSAVDDFEFFCCHTNAYYRVTVE